MTCSCFLILIVLWLFLRFVSASFKASRLDPCLCSVLVLLNEYDVQFSMYEPLAFRLERAQSTIAVLVGPWKHSNETKVESLKN